MPPRVRDRIDSFPTHTIARYGVRPGRVTTIGATLVPNGVNFAVFSARATSVSVVLFKIGAPEPMAEIAIPEDFRIGRVWAITVFGLEYEELEYGFRVGGPNEHNWDKFDSTTVLSDPYAKILGGRELWGRV